VLLWLLSTILWRERELVDVGEPSQFALQAAELDRALLVMTLAQRLKLREDVSLRELAWHLPQPWDGVFEHHCEALASADPEVLPRSLAEFVR
jgi:hypothetical protein